MRLSHLQRYILMESYLRPKRDIVRRDFKKFYQGKSAKPSSRDQQTIVTRSLERLIENELAIGYGRRTPHKWYIESISLTTQGRKFAKKLLGEQQTLPFSSPKKNHE
jgi:hypothetical protein